MHRAADTSHEYTTQSHYPDTEPTSPGVILLMLSVKRGNNQYQFLHLWLGAAGAPTHDPPTTRQTLFPLGHRAGLWKVTRISLTFFQHFFGFTCRNSLALISIFAALFWISTNAIWIFGATNRIFCVLFITNWRHLVKLQLSPMGHRTV